MGRKKFSHSILGTKNLQVSKKSSTFAAEMLKMTYKSTTKF